jgi:hypothetical protein
MRRPMVLVFAIATVWSVSLLATVTDPLTLRQLAAGATLIVRGSITDIRAFPVPGRGIESVATVSVERVIKGESESFVSIRVPGGVVGRYRQVTIGAPALHVNQQAVFFLKRGADNGWRPVGMSAGVVRVRTDAATGRRLVAPVIVQGYTASSGTVVRGDDRRRSLSVEEFEALVGVVMVDPLTWTGAP